MKRRDGGGESFWGAETCQEVSASMFHGSDYQQAKVVVGGESGLHLTGSVGRPVTRCSIKCPRLLVSGRSTN